MWKCEQQPAGGVCVAVLTTCGGPGHASLKCGEDPEWEPVRSPGSEGPTLTALPQIPPSLTSPSARLKLNPREGGRETPNPVPASLPLPQRRRRPGEEVWGEVWRCSLGERTQVEVWGEVWRCSPGEGTQVSFTHLWADQRALCNNPEDADQLVDALRGELAGGHLVASKVALEADVDLVALRNQLADVAVVARALLDGVLKGGQALRGVLQDSLRGEWRRREKRRGVRRGEIMGVRRGDAWCNAR